MSFKKKKKDKPEQNKPPKTNEKPPQQKHTQKPRVHLVLATSSWSVVDSASVTPLGKKTGFPSPSSYQLQTASYLGVRGSFMPTFPSPEHVFLKSINQHVYLCMPICETIADKTMNITLALKAMGV